MLVGRREEGSGASFQGARVRGVRVIHIQMNRLRRSRIRFASVAYFNRSVADGHFRMHDRSIWRRHSYSFCSFKRSFQEVDELRCAPNDDVRSDRLQSRPHVMNGSRLRFPRSCFCCCCAFAHRRSPLQIGFQCCSKLFARQVAQFPGDAHERSQLPVRRFLRAWLQRYEHRLHYFIQLQGEGALRHGCPPSAPANSAPLAIAIVLQLLPSSRAAAQFPLCSAVPQIARTRPASAPPEAALPAGTIARDALWRESPGLAHHNRWPALVDRLGQGTPARRVWRDRRWRSPQFATAKPQMELRAIHYSSSWPAPCETLPTSHLPSLPGPSLGLRQTHTHARNAFRTAHKTSPGRFAPPPPTSARLGILARRLPTPQQPHPHPPAWQSLRSEAGRSWAANPCAPV